MITIIIHSTNYSRLERGGILFCPTICISARITNSYTYNTLALIKINVDLVTNPHAKVKRSIKKDTRHTRLISDHVPNMNYETWLELISEKTKHLYQKLWVRIAMCVWLFLSLLLLTYITPADPTTLIKEDVSAKYKTSHSTPLEALEQPKLEKMDKLATIKPKPVRQAQNKPDVQLASVNRATAPTGWFSDPNQCTAYVASRRPVGQWNNGFQWFAQAQRDGWATGYTPRVGAIGVAVTGNHVVYIERVAGNRVYLSERNYDFNGSYRERWASASSFKYIY